MPDERPERTIDLHHPRRLHVVNVGGAGMSAVATILAQMGHRVSGVDERDTPFLAPLRALGVEFDAGDLPPDTPATLIELELADGKEYWVGLNNFYVITRYNRSPLYAMAVIQLSEAIAARAP